MVYLYITCRKYLFLQSSGTFKLLSDRNRPQKMGNHYLRSFFCTSFQYWIDTISNNYVLNESISCSDFDCNTLSQTQNIYSVKQEHYKGIKI